MRQQGFALIVVVVLLLVISVLGVIALKRSSTDLQTATAAQIAKLTFQANNIAFSKLEEENRADIQAGRMGRRDTLLGYMARPGEQYVGAEVVLCLRKDADKLFDLNNITEKNAQGAVLASTSDRGFCDADNKSHYVSEGRIMTQMTFRKAAEQSENQAFAGEAVGTSSNDFVSTADAVESLCSYFDAHTVSLLPSYSTARIDQVNACLKLPVDDIDVCLTQLGVPHNIQVQTYRGQPTDFKCIS